MKTYFKLYARDHSEDAVDRVRRWREENPERYLALQRKNQREWNAGHPEKVREKNQRRRAAKVNTAIEPVDFVAILKASNHICGICDQPIDMNLKWPNPQSVSEDHIIPLSLGGTHTPENVRPAHLGCNSSRGNRF